jgi:hypothetical protein
LLPALKGPVLNREVYLYFKRVFFSFEHTKNIKMSSVLKINLRLLFSLSFGLQKEKENSRSVAFQRDIAAVICSTNS